MSDERRDTLQWFFRGRRYLEAGHWRVAFEMIGECLAREPGNLLFADALVRAVAGLHADAARPSAWRKLWVCWRIRWGDDTDERTIRRALKILQRTPTEGRAWMVLVQAARKAEAPEVARRLLKHACQVAPDYPPLLVADVESLELAGDFSTASQVANRVRQLDPQAVDQQRIEMLEKLASKDAEPDPAWVFDPSQPPDLLLTEAYQELAAERWARAAQLAMAAGRQLPGDWRVTEIQEDAEIGRERDRAELAEQLAGSGEPERLETARRLQEHVATIELDVLRQRVERYPDRHELQYRLARILVQVGRHAEALPLFEPVAEQQWGLRLERGECLQRLHQFPAALDEYLAVCGGDPPPPPEVLERALYRAAVLSEALEQIPAAGKLWERLVGLAPNYRDAAERLDNHRQIRHKGRFD